MFLHVLYHRLQTLRWIRVIASRMVNLSITWRPTISFTPMHVVPIEWQDLGPRTGLDPVEKSKPPSVPGTEHFSLPDFSVVTDI